MNRRSVLVLATIALVSNACASAPPRDAARPFVSDRISVVSRGKGPDIIFVPGLTSSRDVWAGIADKVDTRYRLHLVQVNGFAGVAPGANADGPVAAPVADEIARYIREAGLKRAAVIGHSMGGTIGMMVAARHPDTVGRLMVVDMPPFMGVMFGATSLDDVRPVADKMRAALLATPPDSPTGMFQQMIPNMTRTEAMRPVLLQHVRGSNPRTVANAFHELLMTDLRPELARITAPLTVLYVIPTNVTISADQFDAAMRTAFTNAPKVRLLKIEDSHHFIQFDQPARFVAEIDTFMRQ